MAITNPIESVPSTPIGGGVRATVDAMSFSGTASTLNWQCNLANVASVQVRGAPTQIVTGTTLDTIVCNNSINETSGYYTLMANATSGVYANSYGTLQFSRAGTNSQNIVVEILSKG